MAEEDDVWKAPDAEESQAPAAPAPTDGDGDGPDDLKDPMKVPTLVWEDLKGHPGPYLMSGLSYFVVSFGFVFGIIAIAGLCVAPGIVIEDETLMIIGGIAGGSVYVFGLLGFVLAVVPLMGASLLRALDEQRRGGPTIGFMSCFSTMRQDAGAIIGFYLLSQLFVFIGIFLFYVPGIIAATIGMFAMPMVVFEGVRPMQAMTLGWEHLKAHPMWHIPVWLLMMVALIALELTIVGLFVLYPVMVAFQLYAYRVAYGEQGALATLD